jgi:bacterioferritin
LGTKAQGIVKISPEEITKMLNVALADEWMAVIQYWAGAQVCKGPQRSDVAKELLAHMDEELAHANKLSKRIIQLGGTPLISPEAMLKAAGSPYEAPENATTSNILAQNIHGEQHAILYYNSILELVRGKDPITHNLIVEILGDEIEHEQDLEDLLFDLSC